MSTKGLKLKSVPIFQNKELVRFMRGKNLNLPELNHLLIDLKGICLQTKQTKCKLTPHSKRVLNEIKFINKVINTPTPLNDDNDILTTNNNNTPPSYDKVTKLTKDIQLQAGVSVLKLNQWNEGYKCPISRKLLLDKITTTSTGVQGRNETSYQQYKADFPKTKLVDYPKILPYRNHTIDNNNNVRNCTLSERNCKQLKEVNITENVPDISRSLKDKRNYLVMLKTKYSSKLHKYFK